MLGLDLLGKDGSTMGDKEYAMLKADGFDDAVLGVATRCAHGDVVVYDYEKCAEVLVERDGMSYEEAIEFLDFNVVGAYVGEGTPFFLHRMTMEEIDEAYDE